MVKRVNLVDGKALVEGKVLETVKITKLDTVEFDGWLIEKYGSNEEIRKVIREAVKDESDKEVTLYVPERNPVSMIPLPEFNVTKFLDKALHNILTEMYKTNFHFNSDSYDDWSDEVDDSISNLLEALFYYMVKNSNAYKREQCHSCWKYILELARMHYESPDWEEDSYRVHVLDTAIHYVLTGAEKTKEAIYSTYENFYSLAHRLAIRIGAHFNEKSITNPESFYKDERGWHILFSNLVRIKGDEKYQDVTFEFTLNDNSNEVVMMVMFDNEKNKSMPEITQIIVEELINANLEEKHGMIKVAPENRGIPTFVFTFKHKGVKDFDFIEDIEEIRNICFMSAMKIAQ